MRKLPRHRTAARGRTIARVSGFRGGGGVPWSAYRKRVRQVTYRRAQRATQRSLHGPKYLSISVHNTTHHLQLAQPTDFCDPVTTELPGSFRVRCHLSVLALRAGGPNRPPSGVGAASRRAQYGRSRRPVGCTGWLAGRCPRTRRAAVPRRARPCPPRRAAWPTARPRRRTSGAARRCSPTRASA
eukprot:scaffold98271_cov63-Phaeocystis_antarctica.AAC.2